MAKFKAGDRVVCVNDNGQSTDINSYSCPSEISNGCVKCVNATGSDLTEGRFYTVRDITDGGALVLHGNDSRPYRRDRFELADNSEWVSQTIREKDAARKEFDAKTLTIETCDTLTVSPPNHNSGWDVEIDHTTNPMSPTVKLKKRMFQLGDTVSPTEVINMPPWILPIESALTVRAIYADGYVSLGSIPDRVPSHKLRLAERAAK
ncbi:hypothetical protein UFOVP1229_151 [uncultured Caudovirales phage]|uniref:Uncharacterized protein n=1 Tax=uncultured Caudovirales phage TaxID=2100421 RepID=A0A6J5R3C8_9CAUD|nr:hypothetical protein UFOVP1229_151 [uncultured Caudovirales phage]